MDEVQQVTSPDPERRARCLQMLIAGWLPQPPGRPSHAGQQVRMTDTRRLNSGTPSHAAAPRAPRGQPGRTGGAKEGDRGDNEYRAFAAPG